MGKKNNRKKLTPQEIERAVEKIRRRYDDYIVTYVKDRSSRVEFEQRYLDARRARVELGRFLADELQWIKRLEESAEQEKRRENDTKGKSAPREKDFADRLIEELRERVQNYPNVGLEAEEVYEVDKLYGALYLFEQEYWPPIDRIYRKIYPSRYSGPRVILENRLFDLVEPTSGNSPKALQPLYALLGRFPRNYKTIEWEAKQAILSASFFLHLIKDELSSLAKEEGIAKEEQREVEKTKEFVHTVIEDFRLTDLKESGKQIRS